MFGRDLDLALRCTGAAWRTVSGERCSRMSLHGTEARAIENEGRESRPCNSYDSTVLALAVELAASAA